MADLKKRRNNQTGEYLYRFNNEFTVIPPMEKIDKTPYPWEEQEAGSFPKITKEFFRCLGNSLNPVHSSEAEGGELRCYYDCGGAKRHSLPLKDGEEFVYPILIDILNEIQLKTGKRVRITSGHRCPEHNTYVDPAPAKQYSKHLIGAEVSFYVQGMESQPLAVLQLIFDYYHSLPKYQNNKNYQEFNRYEKPDTDVAVPPWFNKEIFVKIYAAHEGRDFDNRHLYPYLSIQVRHDFEKDERVVYSWDRAWRNFYRY